MKDERTKFEDIRDTLSDSVCKKYDKAKTYHGGKWVIFEPTDTTEFDDYKKWLAIKKRIENRNTVCRGVKYGNFKYKSPYSL